MKPESEWQPARMINAHGMGDSRKESGRLLKVKPTILTPLEAAMYVICDATQYFECDDGEIVCEHEILTD